MNEKDRDWCAKADANISELTYCDRHIPTAEAPIVSKKHPLILAHVCLYKGSVLVVCDEDGNRAPLLNHTIHTVSHWDDTWLHYEDGAKGEIDWLYYRIIEEGKKPINSDPAMYKQRTKETQQ
tara:strand:+ start:650 stop:1018 length:369 start_codon:yes stop_codon:yes gene_type:complete